MGTDGITKEADMYAFGMVVLEVGIAPGVEIVRLTSRSWLRFSQEGTHSAASNPHSLL